MTGTLGAATPAGRGTKPIPDSPPEALASGRIAQWAGPGTSAFGEPPAIPIRHPIVGVLASGRHGNPIAPGNALDVARINLPVDSQTIITCMHVKQLSMARRDVFGCVDA